MAIKKADPRTLSVATWNIAAINNNVSYGTIVSCDSNGFYECTDH